ncbi:MAG: hypothetical protein GAK43_01262 [Stenotrophomonas maltophilia]|nr:MAG: hypothetical protein GAK43_01262 [Stenotrophomonas maltophilia]
MEIVCPKCSKPNGLELDAQCAHCQEALNGHRYGRVKKTTGVVALAFAAGVIGTKKLVDYKGLTHRYSIKTEYSLISLCLNGAQASLAGPSYRSKAEDCTCALSVVQETQPANSYNDQPRQFMAAFENAAMNCRSQRLELN